MTGPYLVVPGEMLICRGAPVTGYPVTVLSSLICLELDDEFMSAYRATFAPEAK